MDKTRTALFSLRLLTVLIVVSVLTGAFGNISTASAGNSIWTTMGPEGLTVLALAIDPFTPSILYAGTDGSGLFKSTDGGETWNAANSGLLDADLRFTALAIDPDTPATLYAGSYGGGTFKSTDRGESWNSV